MRIVLDIREDAFRTPKTLEQVIAEMRQAMAVFWVARGDVAPDAAHNINMQQAQEQEGTLYDLLMQGPNVGEDADFERPVDYGREQPAWDT